MKKTPAILAVGLIGLATLAVSPAASAAEATPTGIVVAQDTARGLSAVPVAPRTVEIQALPGNEITVTATGERSRKVRADRQGTARVTGLTAGMTYTVTTADAATTVTPMLAAGRARNLQVTTTDAADAVLLTWQHRATQARGEIGYRVEAAPVGESDTVALTIVDEVSNTQATLTGLDPLVRYSFSVTPYNALGDGQASLALMNRSLAAMTGLAAPTAKPEPVPTTPVAPRAPQAPSQTEPASAPSLSNPAPAAAPTRPSTRTVWLCPDGFADQGGACTRSMAYTYQNQGYTYTRGKIGTEEIRAICSTGYTDPDGVTHYTVQPHECTITRDVFGNIKDPTPAGWEDTGSNWRKKDDSPTGWSDDGSQWVQTTDKVAQVVPA